jgi:hypothetical protein
LVYDKVIKPGLAVDRDDLFRTFVLFILSGHFSCCGLRVADCELRVTRFELRGSELPGSRYWQLVSGSW